MIPTDLFHHNSLAKESGLEEAFKWLKSCKRLEPVLFELLATPGLLEYLLSGASISLKLGLIAKTVLI